MPDIGAHASIYPHGMDDETVTLHLTKPEAFALPIALRLAGVLTVPRAHSLEAIEGERRVRAMPAVRVGWVVRQGRVV